MDRLRLPTRLYLVILGAVTLGLASLTLARTRLPDLERLLLTVVFASLTTITFLFPLQSTPGTKLSFHTSAIFAATLLFAPGLAMLIAGMGTMLAYVIRRRPWDEGFFNISQIMLQVGVSGLILASVGWNFDKLMFDRPALILAVFVAAGVMYLIESFSIATIIVLQTRQSPLLVLRQVASVDVELLSQFALGLLAAVIASVHILALPLLVPLALVIYRSSARQVQLHQQAQVLAHQAFHDALTALPNRALLLDRLEHALARAARHQEAIAILFLDLDRFKVVNDSLGHEAGDQLLVAVAKRLQACLRPEDTVARLGGDEFTVLLEGITQVSDATHVAERIKQVLQAPFIVVGHEVFITASIGIALSGLGFGQHDPGELLRDADAAMYKAKGKARYEIFDANINARALDRLKLESDLNQAIERKEFKVYYQPQVEITTGRILGLEALVRWQHPQHGLMSPSEFIPLAEETRLILPIGQWVLEEACRQARAWQEQYPHDPPLFISVNLSAKQFQNPALPEMVAQILEDTKLDPHRLKLEITESVLMEDVQSAIALLQELKDLGVQLAIDDFGTGYSSLSYLKHFRVEMLKVDKSFIERVGQDPADTAIVQTATALAQTLGMQVVAEGVETAEQLLQLRALGCNWGQGFYFSRPLPSEAIAVLLAKDVRMRSELDRWWHTDC
jgi:diguanylate cyclase (GGDEF)-like protein